jgi:endogenous inhibitor of DNA gyrase (YacG/DUF329 family)
MSDGTCLAPNCADGATVRGLCRRHYCRWHGAKPGYHDYEPLPVRTREDKGCSVEGCAKKHCARGYCSTHWAHNDRYGTPHRRQRTCPRCGSTTTRDDFEHELGGYCSRECFDVQKRERADARRARLKEETELRLRDAEPIKCGGCKGTYPALQFLGVHGRQTKRCQACRDKASTYRTRDEARDLALRRAYGISASDYDRMFAEQAGVCAICAQPETARRHGRTARLAIDHCHASGEVRGLLCSACNIGLGKFRDDIARLRRAIEYLNSNAP